LKAVGNIKGETIKVHLLDVWIMWHQIRYPITNFCYWITVIRHPHDHAPILWQIGAQRINHDQEFCYRYNNYNNDNNIITWYFQNNVLLSFHFLKWLDCGFLLHKHVKGGITFFYSHITIGLVTMQRIVEWIWDEAWICRNILYIT